jgi:hypothetical protein
VVGTTVLKMRAQVASAIAPRQSAQHRNVSGASVGEAVVVDTSHYG